MNRFPLLNSADYEPDKLCIGTRDITREECQKDKTL